MTYESDLHEIHSRCRCCDSEPVTGKPARVERKLKSENIVDISETELEFAANQTLIFCHSQKQHSFRGNK